MSFHPAFCLRPLLSLSRSSILFFFFSPPFLSAASLASSFSRFAILCFNHENFPHHAGRPCWRRPIAAVGLETKNPSSDHYIISNLQPYSFIYCYRHFHLCLL